MAGDRLLGKVALISGAARGIGAAAARAFVSEGAQVVIGDILEREGADTAGSLGAAAEFVRLDVTSEDDWAAAVAACGSMFGAPTVLVNNAGRMVIGPVEQTTVEQFRLAYEVNVIGAFLGTRAVLPSMKARGGGAIVSIASGAGLEGTPGLPAYAASKAASISLVRTSAMELGRYGIRVNTIAPGGIDTMMSNSPEFDGMDKDALYGALPVPRIGTVDDIASAMVFLASDESAYMTGTTTVVDGGMTAGRYAM